MTRLLAIAYDPYVGPGIVPKDGTQATTNLENTVSVVLGMLSVVALIYFTIQTVFAGYAFMSSKGDEKKLEEARHKITNGILGIAIVIFAVGLGSLLGKILGLENIFNLDTLLNDLHL
ncbi:MAG: hypothetical protein WC841_04080 [Candidatus Shapirobacteria bacterium]|jgi:hypothetical protein